VRFDYCEVEAAVFQWNVSYQFGLEYHSPNSASPERQKHYSDIWLALEGYYGVSALHQGHRPIYSHKIAFFYLKVQNLAHQEWLSTARTPG
jgi:hypothetical protein